MVTIRQRRRQPKDGKIVPDPPKQLTVNGVEFFIPPVSLVWPVLFAFDQMVGGMLNKNIRRIFPQKETTYIKIIQHSIHGKLYHVGASQSDALYKPETTGLHFYRLSNFPALYAAFPFAPSPEDYRRSQEALLDLADFYDLDGAIERRRFRQEYRIKAGLPVIHPEDIFEELGGVK